MPLNRKHKQTFQTNPGRVEQGHQFCLPLSHLAWQWRNHWCAGRDIDLFLCHVRDCFDFLAELEGLEHGTVSSIRSVVSMQTLCHVEGVPIGHHPLVTRLLEYTYIALDHQDRIIWPHVTECGFSDRVFGAPGRRWNFYL